MMNILHIIISYKKRLMILIIVSMYQIVLIHASALHCRMLHKWKRSACEEYIELKIIQSYVLLGFLLRFLVAREKGMCVFFFFLSQV